MSLPDSMTALVLRHDGYAGTSTGPAIDRLDDWLELQTIPVPQAAGRNVLVKIGLANINPSDLHYIKGEYGQPRRKGVPAGFEAMGEVVAAGDDEGKALVGRRVALSVVPTGSGAYAEYALTDRASVVPLAEGLRDEDGAALIVNPLTAFAMVHLAKERGSNGFVMTAGASQLGKLMASLARDEGMQAIAVVRREEHRATLIALGASHVLDTQAPDYAQALQAALQAAKPRVLLDAVGDQTAADIFTAMPAGAAWVPYGVLATEPPLLKNLGQFIFMGKTVEGFWLTQWLGKATPEKRREAFETVQKRFISGAWKTDVAATLSLDEAPAKLAEALKGMNRGKVLLRPSAR